VSLQVFTDGNCSQTTDLAEFWNCVLKKLTFIMLTKPPYGIKLPPVKYSTTSACLTCLVSYLTLRSKIQNDKIIIMIKCI
jgi:hypothetical protein